ncbi:MAG: hypothetical protein WAT39_21735 [Planctomycetota bacterium]
MSPSGPVPFAVQRLVFMALLLGMTMYIVAVAVVLQMGGGKGLAEPPIAPLDTVVIAVAAASATAAFVLRPVLLRAVAGRDEAARSQAAFRATLIPVAMLEGGCLLATTAWLLNGNVVPNLVAALVLLSLAIAIVPFSDPDAGGR